VDGRQWGQGVQERGWNDRMGGNGSKGWKRGVETIGSGTMGARGGREGVE
jgi:hypothetical protein